MKDPSQGLFFFVCLFVCLFLASAVLRNKERPQPGKLFEYSCQRLEKDSNSTLSHASMAAGIPVHLVPWSSPWSKQLCHLHTQSSPRKNFQRLGKNLNTYWHISCACGHQLPCVPVVARVPTIQATVPPPHHWGRRKPSRAASVANSCGWPTCKKEIKPKLNSMDRVAKDKDKKIFPPAVQDVG